MTDIISVIVQLMEAWPASSGCQQASVGELSVVQADLYLRPILCATTFIFIFPVFILLSSPLAFIVSSATKRKTVM